MTAAACPIPYRMPVREALSWQAITTQTTTGNQKVFTVFGISARMGMDATVLGFRNSGKWICRHGEDLPGKNCRTGHPHDKRPGHNLLL